MVENLRYMVTSQSEGYLAYLKSFPSVAGRGKSRLEAIKSLVASVDSIVKNV